MCDFKKNFPPRGCVLMHTTLTQQSQSEISSYTTVRLISHKSVCIHLWNSVKYIYFASVFTGYVKHIFWVVRSS